MQEEIFCLHGIIEALGEKYVARTVHVIGINSSMWL